MHRRATTCTPPTRQETRPCPAASHVPPTPRTAATARCSTRCSPRGRAAVRQAVRLAVWQALQEALQEEVRLMRGEGPWGVLQRTRCWRSARWGVHVCALCVLVCWRLLLHDPCFCPPSPARTERAALYCLYRSVLLLLLHVDHRCFLNRPTCLPLCPFQPSIPSSSIQPALFTAFCSSPQVQAPPPPFARTPHSPTAVPRGAVR